eukprot:794976-Rhodomonas_salina.2
MHRAPLNQLLALMCTHCVAEYHHRQRLPEQITLNGVCKVRQNNGPNILDGPNILSPFLQPEPRQRLPLC